MGNCLTKKDICSASSPFTLPSKITSVTQPKKKRAEEESTLVKEEIFVIERRKSHEIEAEKGKEIAVEIVESTNKNPINENGIIGVGVGVGGGGGVRSSSCTKEELDAILIQCGRLSRSSSIRKSGSKTSFDFDKDGKKNAEEEDVEGGEERGKRRDRPRSKSHGPRRTPSREREREPQQRSGSRERSVGGRRVSRSPGRRSDSPITTSSNSNSNANGNNSRPGKMVSVPATVSSSLAMDKSSDGGVGELLNSAVAVKRNQLKRNNDRTDALARARSPARVRDLNENVNCSSQNKQQQIVSLSRSNSRKAEHSPCRRNPLSEINTNIISQASLTQKPNADNRKMQVSHSKTKEQQQLSAGHVGLNVISSGPENPKPHKHTRTRSSRLSRDLDSINPEALSNPNNNTSSSYTALLLDDIQNFHQKKNNTSPDISDSTEQMNKNITAAKIRSSSQETKEDPFLESEVIAGNDDLMEPSFHKYITTIRSEEEFDEQESSGSNSFVGWDHNSVESNEHFTATTSRSDFGKRSSAKKRDCDNRQKGIGRGRIGSRGTQMAPGSVTST